MHTMNQSDLLRLLAIPSCSGATDRMRAHLLHLLPSLGADTVIEDRHGNVLATRGDVRGAPCIVAHTDTVHELLPDGRPITPVVIGRRVIGYDAEAMHPAGIGGDDKCGIWVALRALEALPDITILLCVDEETGCRGSGAVDMAWIAPAGCLIQADRRGITDAVTDICGPICSRAFWRAAGPILRRAGYAEARGAMTDVMELADRGAGVSAINLSAGYHLPHSDHEWIDLDQLDHCAHTVVDLCRTLTGRRWPHARHARAGWYYHPRAAGASLSREDRRAARRAARSGTVREWNWPAGAANPPALEPRDPYTS